jgi:hypothetical protein
VSGETRCSTTFVGVVDEEIEVDGDKLGVVLGGIKASYAAIDQGLARTYGELMVAVANEGKFTRHYTERFSKTRKDEKPPEPENKMLPYRSDRALIRAEFHRIFDKQANFHPNTLTQELREELEDIIFRQKELGDNQDKRKSCPVYESSLCASQSSDAFQRSRILKDLFNSFVVGDKPKKSKLLNEIPGQRVTFSEKQLAALLPDLMDGINLTIEEILMRVGTSEAAVTVVKRSVVSKYGMVFGHHTRRLLRDVTGGGYDSWNKDIKTKVQDVINSALCPNALFVKNPFPRRLLN